jgi:predicted amidophosphoribosyltransferase
LAERVFSELASEPAGATLGDSTGGTAGAPPENAAVGAAGGLGGELPDLITPVPSHWLRRLHRGGGGCRIVAAAVHRWLRRSHPGCLYRDCLRVTRRIEKQAWLGEKERESNVRDAFRLAGRRRFGRRHQHLGGRTVLLVDDVMTTGATSNEVARVLKAAGAGRVVVAVVARALGR